MDLQLAALADAANVSREGKLNILGEFNTLFTVGVPTSWPIMYFVAKVTASQMEGAEHTLQLRVLDEDAKLAAPILEMHARFGESTYPGVPYTGTIIVPVQNPVFQRFGEYTFELRRENTIICTLPLYVREATPEGNVAR